MIVTAAAPHHLIVRVVGAPTRRRAWCDFSHRLDQDHEIEVDLVGNVLSEWPDELTEKYELMLDDEIERLYGPGFGRAPALPEPFDMAALEEQRDDVADDLDVERVHLTGPGLLP